MYRIKQLIKKVLIRLHILKRPEPIVQVQEEKTIPDFDIESREQPVFVMQAGKYLEQLDNQERPLIALQVHVYFMDVMEEIVEVLNSIPYPFDCYVSTNTNEKKKEITELLRNECQIHYLQVDVMDNRGRDVGPFLQQMEPIIQNYKYIAHLHTKKSKHVDFGDDWRRFLFRNLFGGKEIVSAILEKFEQDEKLGMVIPEVYPIVRECLAWDNTKDDVQQLLESMGLHARLAEVPICPVGDFFWARTDAIKILFEQGFKQSDFQEEAGQINYTLAHVIERIWCYMVQAQGYRYEVCVNGIENTSQVDNRVKRVAIYACSEEITQADCFTIKKITENFEITFFAVQDADTHQKVLEMTGVDSIICNTDNCKQMWKNVLLDKQQSIKEADEVALIDNSGIGPLFDLKQIMNLMSVNNHECWSLFKTNISKSIFSIVNLRKIRYEDVLSMIERDDVMQIAYVKESAYIGKWLFTEKPISELAFDYIILHAPFVKKVSVEHTRVNEKYLLDRFFEIINIV